MMVTRFTRRCVSLMVTLGLVLTTSGCFFNLSKEKDFKSWYFGEPGMAGALGQTRCDPHADRIFGERHPYYLHFRTLEVFYQPQGGTHYPERSAVTVLDGEGGRMTYACEIVDEGRETFNFNAVDAGLVDVIVPYRKLTATQGDPPRNEETGSYAGGLVYNAGIATVMKAPVYVVHDVLKTIYLPVAGTYFLFKSDEDQDADAVAVTDQENDPATEAEIDTPAAEESIPEGAESADKVDSEVTPLVAVDETVDTDTPLNAAAEVPGGTGEEGAPRAPDNAVVAPQTTIADAPAAGRPVGPTDPASTETDSDIAAADTGTGESVDASEGPSDRETAATNATEVLVSPPAPETGASGTGTTESEAVAVTAAQETIRAGDEPGTVDASHEATIHEEDLTDVSTDQAVAETRAAATSEPSGEEGPPMVAGAYDVEAPAKDMVTDPPAPAEETSSPERVDHDASGDIASVTKSRESLASVALPPVQLEEVKISRRKLKKQIAFLGFTSRVATVSPELKAFFEERLWPAFLDECSPNIHMLQSGDPRFPDALTQLTRDQFGRLNSFELITLARFSGINAVVTGSVVDIRIANEIGGILWYKEPEGTMRVAIQVEVYDAETGTKLLDKTMVHQMEVDELAPGSEGKLRDEDMVFVQIALGSIAADMSEMVCDVLDDQPWRAYVTGIDGSRITLSAGADTGLVPGNILTVYNSQIIEGLNNQQFFLTGERVGRLQIVQVFPDRSEANLIEGANLQDYSLILPE